MRSWSGRIAAVILSVGVSGGAAAGLVDCGPEPTVACLSAAVFSLAKTLPDDSYVRKQAGFAEQELAPGDIKTALEYVVAEAAAPPPWWDIEWIAQAGRLDRAIERAKQASSPVERLGGLLAVATQMLDRSDLASGQAKQGSSLVERLGGLFTAATRHLLDRTDTANAPATRAARIVDEVERDLASIARDDDDEYLYLLEAVPEIWARLGQTERAARLLGTAGAGSVTGVLAIVNKYPAAASLRELAWRKAERANNPWEWQALLKDAMSRGDKADASRAAQLVSRRMDAGIDGDYDNQAIALAGVLLEAGFLDLSARLAGQWTRWIEGKAAGWQTNNIVNAVIPLLVRLKLDRDVQSAVNTVSDVFDRSQYLSKAAEEYRRAGRNDVARKLDAEAQRLEASLPADDPKLQAHRDFVLQSLAIERAGRGDIPGARHGRSTERRQARSRHDALHRQTRDRHWPRGDCRAGDPGDGTAGQRRSGREPAAAGGALLVRNRERKGGAASSWPKP